jgi:hypothetical protein
MDAGAVGPCIEVASAMAMLISPDYGTPRDQLNPGAQTPRRFGGIPESERQPGSRRPAAPTNLPFARQLGYHGTPADHLSGERRYGPVEEIFSHANEGGPIADPDARRAHFADAFVGKELL